MAKQSNVARYDVDDLPIVALNKNNWNPNFVSSAMMKAIQNNIEQHGFIEPIIVQKHNTAMDKDYVIINGEHRFQIMKDKGEDNIDCIVLDVDDTTAKALSIRLNREHGELFPDATSRLLKDLSPELDFGKLKQLTWMSDGELRAFGEIDTTTNGNNKTTKTTKVKEATCPNCNHTFQLT